MNQDYENQNSNSNRFIFSSSFYDELDNSVETKDSNSLFDAPVIDIPQIKNDVEKEENVVNSLIDLNNNIKLVENDSNLSDLGFQKLEQQQEKVKNGFDFSLEKQSDTTIFQSNAINKNLNDNNVYNIDDINNSDNSTSNVNINNNVIEPITTVTMENNSIDISSKNPINFEEHVESLPKVDVNTSKFDVDSGINVDLEKEIMKSDGVEDEVINQEISMDNDWLIKPEEVSSYRVSRKGSTNANINNFYAPPVNNQFDVDNSKNELEEANERLNNNININDGWYPTPDVINIDEKLEQEAYQNYSHKEESEVIDNTPAIISDLLTVLRKKEQETGKISILARYGEDFCSNNYITNPAIGREEEIKQLILILLTPEKSGILVGKPGIGKTSIVEGLAYRLQRNNVPEALKGYRIVSVKTTSLLGTLPNGETRLQTLIDELKDLNKIILFIDEIHMLMGATSESSMDFANMFKESLGRGSIKMIGATTTDEYERYVLRDKAFVRRFQRVDVEEPSRDHTIKILMGTLPKIEKNSGAKLKYSNYIQTEIMSFIVDITSEYKRIYGIGSRYPDICLTLLSQAFSQAVFDNRQEVNIFDIRNAITNSKNIYPDVIRKEIINFDEKFKKIIDEEKTA